MTISILLADDHPIVRYGLRRVLEAEPGFAVVGEAGDGLEAAAMAGRLRPDVLVLDVMMPGLNGLDVAREVERRAPGTRVLVLSMYANEAHVLQALRNGASGYVLKMSSPEELVEAVRVVAAGRTYLSRTLSQRAIEVYRDRARECPPDPYDRLTPREREVLHLAVEGLTSAAIAARLEISRRTVEMHRGNLMRKLDLQSHSDLIRFAVRKGILSADGELGS